MANFHSYLKERERSVEESSSTGFDTEAREGEEYDLPKLS